MTGYSREKKVKYGLAASVAVVVFIVYLATLQNEFVEWDDSKYVIGNTHIRSFDTAFFRWAFFDFYAANWHPLTWISHALDYAIWGLKPLGHHLTNNILHAVNTFLVVLLVTRLLEFVKPLSAVSYQLSAKTDSRFTSHDSRFTLIAAATTGLLFGLHPLHVESVAWVAERKDLLCALFYLLSIMAYVRYAGRGGPMWPPKEGQPRRVAPTRTYILSLIFFTLALLSKPMAVTLPFVLLILDWYPFSRIQSLSSFRPVFIEKLPFIALSLISSVLTILAQKAGGAVQSLDFAPLLSRLLVASHSLSAYLWKMLLPLDLVPYYPYPKSVSPLSLKYLSAFALVLGVTAACAAMRKKQKLLLSAWVYYVVTLIPVLGIVQVGGQAMADRYTYLPSLGPFLLIGLLVAWVSARIHTVKKHAPVVKLVGVIAYFVVLFFLSSLTLRQIAVWKDSFSLWNYVIKKEPERAPEAYNNRGLTFSDNGRLKEAIEDYTKAIAINPIYSEALINRAIAFTGLGQIDKAIEDYSVVIRSNPFDQVFYLRGEAFERKGETEKAIEDYHQAIGLNPSYLEAYIRLGVLYGKSGAFDKAIDQFNQAVTINPDYPMAYGNRGFAYSLMGQYELAIRDLTRAIELDKNDAASFVNRGKVYRKISRKELAIQDFRKACDMGSKEGCVTLEALQKQ
jgi:lipoprotein NlpI